MGMMKLLWGMSSSDRWYPSVPGDRGWKPPWGILDWCLRTEGWWGGQRMRTTRWGWHRGLVLSTIEHSQWGEQKEWVQWCLNETGPGSALVLVLMKDWGDEDEMRCRCAWLGLRWNQVRASDDNDDWLLRRTDRSVTVALGTSLAPEGGLSLLCSAGLRLFM